MGQKANPIGNRLGIIRGWDSNWLVIKKLLQLSSLKTQKLEPT